MFGQGRQHRRWGLPEVESVHLGSLAELWEMGEVRHLDEPASDILGGATRLANRWGAPDTSLADRWGTGALLGGVWGCCNWRRRAAVAGGGAFAACVPSVAPMLLALFLSLFLSLFMFVVCLRLR